MLIPKGEFPELEMLKAGGCPRFLLYYFVGPYQWYKV